MHDIGLIGLAVMGQNLALNIARNGFSITVYNRTGAVTEEFMARSGKAAGMDAAFDPAALVASLSRPRKIICMVKAGGPVDAVIDALAPLLDPGDLIIDGGNSHFSDTERRSQALAAKGLRFMGAGISGGEEGALWGPSIMPGGDAEAWELVKPIFTAIAGKAPDGEPCVAHMGRGGAGHYVKMTHNGIEYGDMQLIAECYDLLRAARGMDAPALAKTFAAWNEGPLSSYLIEITGLIFTRMDEDTGEPLVSRILDKAGQKGTGRWTSASALELGVPAPTLAAAVDARVLSSQKARRVAASKILAGPSNPEDMEGADFPEVLGQALYAAKICSYAQGFALLRAADAAYGYGLRFGDIAAIWRAGCIIRAAFLDDVRAAFAAAPDISNLMLAPFFSRAMNEGQKSLRRAVAAAALRGVPVPALSASLAYYDACRSARLPANLIQAQRDYFGAHTFERIDKEGVFHADWTA